MEKNVLKSAFFGFSKTSVCEYIADMNIEFNDKVNELNKEHSDEIEWWRKKTSDLEKELAGLKSIKASLDDKEEEILSLKGENEKLKAESLEKSSLIDEKEKLADELSDKNEELKEENKNLKEEISEKISLMDEKAKLAADLFVKSEELKEENKNLSEKITEKEEAVKAVLEEKELLYQKLNSIPDERNRGFFGNKAGKEIVGSSEEKPDIANIISDTNILRLYKYKNYIIELQNDLNRFIDVTNRDINNFFGEFDVKLKDFSTGRYLKEDK